MTQLWRRFLFVSSVLSALSASTSVSVSATGNSTDAVPGYDGPAGSCPYTEVFLNDFALTVTPTGSNTAVDLRSYVSPSYPTAGEWRYVIERGDDLPTGTITFTPTSFTAGSTFRIRTNFAEYTYLSEGEAVSTPLKEGTNLLEFDVIQAPCQGTDIQEYSITLYQNGTSKIPPVVVTPPDQGGSEENPPTPTPTPAESSTAVEQQPQPPVVESSTGVAPPSTPEQPQPPVNPPTTCPYTQVYLNSFSLFLQPSGSNAQVDFLPYISPSYSPEGPEWRYVIERGSDLATGTIIFTPLDFTAGSTFRVRFNHGDYIYAVAGESVEAPLIEGSDLIEFDVIQAPCAGTDIQEYAITLYQNGTSKVPTLPPVVIPPTTTPTPPAQGGEEQPPAPPAVPEQPPTPPVQPPTAPSDETPLPPVIVQPAGDCPLINYTYLVAPSTDANANGGIVITFTNTDSTYSVMWVDFHVSINAALVAGSASVDAPQFNYRMVAGADGKTFTLAFPTGTDDVDFSNVDYINFFFTYCADHTDCNSAVFNYQLHKSPSQGGSEEGSPSTPAPAPTPAVPTTPLVCQAVNFTQYTSIGSQDNGEENFSFSWYSTTEDVDVMWVDIHVTISSATVNGMFNYRMFESDVSAADAAQFQGFVPKKVFFITMPGVDGVTIPKDASVSYFFTYCAEMTDCNTDSFNLFRNPEQGGLVVSGSVCPAVEYVDSWTRDASNPNIVTVTFTKTGPSESTIGWVDVHVSINTALLDDGKGAYSPQYNYRMKAVNDSSFSYTFPGIDGVGVPTTSYVDYFFTYCSSVNGQMTDCNTQKETFGATEAVVGVATQKRSLVARADANANANANSASGPTSSSNSDSNADSNANANANSNANSGSSSSSSSNAQPGTVVVNTNSAMTKSTSSAFLVVLAGVVAALAMAA